METIFPIEFCPRCGTVMTNCGSFGQVRMCCSICDNKVYHNPLPAVGATVIDGDSMLLVRRAHPPDEGTWSLPGGFLELHEVPSEGAARELHEETGVIVDPLALSVIGTDFVEYGPDFSVVSILFAVNIANTICEPAASDDATEVRYWTREEIALDPPELVAGDVVQLVEAIDRLGGAVRPTSVPVPSRVATVA